MDNINVTVTGGTLPEKEINAYISHGKEKYSGKTIKAMDIKVDGDLVSTGTRTPYGACRGAVTS